MGWLGGLREDMPTALKASLLRKALAEFQEANRLFPQDVYILMAIGNCLDGLGMPEAAEAPYLSAIEWAPNYQETRLSYAIHLHRMGRFDEAEKAYAHARLGHPLRHHNETRPYIDSLVKRLEEDRKQAEEEKAASDSDLPPIL
jgi:tetratricopeptide (TPR) repeat protein